jgi:hypothetical protein
MKKIILSIAAMTAAASAAPFNGFYVGGQFNAFMSKTTGDVNVNNNLTVGTFKGSKTLPGMGVFAGYNRSFGNMFAGVEVIMDSTFSSSKFIGKDDLTDTKITYKNGLGVGMAARLGYKFNDTMALFGKFTVKASKNEVKGEFLGLSLKDKQTVWYYTPAIGLEKAFGNVSVNGTLGYAFSKKTKFKSGVFSVLANHSGPVVTVGVAYNF